MEVFICSGQYKKCHKLGVHRYQKCISHYPEDCEVQDLVLSDDLISSSKMAPSLSVLTE